jgi:hypothetical protein
VTNEKLVMNLPEKEENGRVQEGERGGEGPQPCSLVPLATSPETAPEIAPETVTVTLENNTRKPSSVASLFSRNRHEPPPSSSCRRPLKSPQSTQRSLEPLSSPDQLTPKNLQAQPSSEKRSKNNRRVSVENRFKKMEPVWTVAVEVAKLKSKTTSKSQLVTVRINDSTQHK